MVSTQSVTFGDGVMCQLYVDLYIELVRDVAELSQITHKESHRDIQEIEHRVRQEGMSFLTKTLPRLGKAFTRSLAQGTPFLYRGLETRRGTATPKLFGSWFERVFDSSGSELPDSDDASTECKRRAVLALRQLTDFVYKLELPHSAQQEGDLLAGFEAVDMSLPTSLAGISGDTVFEVARNIVTSVFSNFDWTDINPKHGPGSVATGEKNHAKHRFRRLYSQIEQVYPFTEYYMFGLSHIVDQPDYLTSLKSMVSGTAKVVLVPKDSRGPRIISCEPLEYQWIQQGLGRAIVERLESHHLTKGQVNFTDQNVNRDLALSSSIDQQWSTLDMKEASDRVSMVLVEELFRDVPNLLNALKATRSTATRLPSGNVVHMKKFAPMGSCLCFPVEAFVFYALALATVVVRDRGNRPKCRTLMDRKVLENAISRAAKTIFVYGDDIIMRTEDYSLALQYFPTVGLMFNADKCCTKGFYKESCGMDAYKGLQVTPLRLKKLWCHRRVDPVVVGSYVSMSNAAYTRGFRRVALHIKCVVESMVGVLPVLPASPDIDPLLSREHLRSKCYGGWIWVRPGSSARFQRRGVKSRWNTDLQRREVLTRQARPDEISVPADDWCMVLRRLTSPSERNAPGVFAITRRSICQRVWIPAPL